MLSLNSLRGTTVFCLSDFNRICHLRQPHVPSFHAQNQDFLFSLGFMILSLPFPSCQTQPSDYSRDKKEKKEKKTNNRQCGLYSKQEMDCVS